MRHAACSWIVAVGFLTSVEAAGATPLRLTIDEAVARAVAANPELNANRKDIDLAEANLQRSKSWLPSNPYFSGGAQRTSQSDVGPNYAFLLSQELEIGGQRGKRIDTATQGVEKAAWEIKSAEQNLAATVKTAFVQALIAVDRVTLAHQGVDAAAELSKELAHRKQLSDTQRIDLNVAQIQEARARRDVAAAERARDNAQDMLRRLLGLPVDQEIELAGTPRYEVKDMPAGPELVARALRQRADLVALLHSVQRADLQLTLVQREAIPNITVSGTLSRFEGDTLTGGDVGLPIPIFHRKSADVREAIAERDRASLQRQNLERSITQEALEARRACLVAAADLQSFKNEVVPKSEENLRIEQRLYERGAVAVSELIGVQIDLLTAKREHLDALQAYNESLIELERVVGGSL